MQQPGSRTVVAVCPTSALDRRPRLFAALAEAFSVRFAPFEAVADATPAGVLEIAENGAPPSLDELCKRGVPTLAVAGAAHETTAAVPIVLTGVPLLDRRVRDIVLADRPAATAARDADGATLVLAHAEGAGPVWTARAETSDGARARTDRVVTALPELGDGEILYTMLSRRPIATIALIGFLRAVQSPSAAVAPAPRACLLFDDPNLRWRTYGHIDYQELLAHAVEHDYHVSMAMVPLDAGRAHPPTAQLYARHADRLSLVFHGNDHVDNELLAADGDDAALALAAQAVRRVAAFEARTGLRVDRVMTPPHGLCSQAMTHALGAVGFDGLCAIHPRPWTPEWPADPPLVGWSPADFVEGCAVIPRIPFGSSDADIALRALLDHPLVVYGHQEDVAGGLEPLAEIADRVRRVVGEVRWTSIGELARTNVAVALEGDVAVVHPYARRVRVELPAGVNAVRVCAPRDAVPEARLAGWATHDNGTVLPLDAPVPVETVTTLDLRLVGPGDVCAGDVPAPAWSPWPRLRRAATEARDRAAALRAAIG
jgi:hypothetical protein